MTVAVGSDAGLQRFSLRGRHAIVTGASRGIGEMLAVGLAEAGADVAVCSRDVAALQPVVARIGALGRRAHAFALDVTETDRIDPAFEEVAEALGGLDLLVNNAGIEEVCPSLQVTEALWDRIVDTNLKSAFFCAQAAARRIQPRGGAILNVCSLTSGRGIPAAVPYGSAKSGLLGMTRALAAEWAPLRVRVNAIGPGYFRTALTEPFYQDPAWAEAMLKKIPQGRFGVLPDLVGSAVFLCSDAARYITGQLLYVDGGTMAAL